jgi:hypothetical protein
MKEHRSMASLTFAAASFEPVYGWFEQHPGLAVEVWALEDARAVALLAYCDGPDDDFGWANWARSAYDDPSELSALFERLQIEAEDSVTTQLGAAFPGLFAAA